MPRSHGLGKPLALHRAMNHSEHGPRPCHKQSDSSSGVAIKPSSFPASAAASCRLQALRWQSQRRSRCVTDSDPTCVPASESTASGMGSIVSRSEACQALFAAAKANDTDEVARQLAAGALANWRASGKVRCQAQRNARAAVRRVWGLPLQQERDGFFAIPQARLTPLHWAARHGNAELVRLLLAHGAVLEAKSAVRRRQARELCARNSCAVRMLVMLRAGPLPFVRLLCGSLRCIATAYPRRGRGYYPNAERIDGAWLCCFIRKCRGGPSAAGQRRGPRGTR